MLLVMRCFDCNNFIRTFIEGIDRGGGFDLIAKRHLRGGCSGPVICYDHDSGRVIMVKNTHPPIKIIYLKEDK